MRGRSILLWLEIGIVLEGGQCCGRCCSGRSSRWWSLVAGMVGRILVQRRSFGVGTIVHHQGLGLLGCKH